MSIIIVIYGLLIGSFLNVCIYRIPRGESIAFPPSHCTNCKNNIKAYDLVPVVSYIFLRGKCRYCGEKISIIYPAIELINAILYYFIYLKYGLTIEFIKFALIISLLMVIGIIDFRTTDVYFSVTFTGMLLGMASLIYYLFNGISISTYIYGALLGGGFISLIILLTGGMGWGDAEICFLCGLFLGLKLTMLMLFLSFIIGGFTGALLIMMKKKKKVDYIPFGPSIALAACLSILIGNNIIIWYLR